MKLGLWCGLLGMVAIAATAGCGGNDCNTFNCGNPDGSVDGGGTDGKPFGFGDSGDGSSCARSCSSDLHDVIDCNKNVVMQCPGDQGCAGGQCIAACDAAAANKSTIGCDFYAGTVAPEYETRGGCYAVLLANTWTAPISITASYGSQTLNVASMARIPSGSGTSIQYGLLPNNQLPPGQIGILFLSTYPSGDSFYVPCPSGVTAGVGTSTAVDQTGVGTSFHITASAPVVAYDIYPYGGASSFVTSASLLIPTPAWGTNYVAADAYTANPALAGFNGFPYIQIYAQEAGTKVAITPTAAIVGGGGLAATAANATGTYTLDNGQFIQFLQNDELNGSLISSNKPISVWGGSSCMNTPLGTYACDSGHQQLMPVQSLGNQYVGVRYRDRAGTSNETVPWRIVGAVDGTQLAYDPIVSGAPLTIQHSQMVEFSNPGPFSVHSQDDKHPFYIAQYMTGASLTSDDSGDPEMVNIVPPAQWLNSYLFLTDPTYANTNLVFVRQKASDNNFHDVTLDCQGVLSGWQGVGSGGQFQFTRVDLRVSGAAQGNCDNGVHTAKSDVPFGLTVWGFDTTVSYGYPAGMSVTPINTVVVGPPPPN